MRGKRRLKINGEGHRLVALEVLSRDAFGRPDRVRILYDDSTTETRAGQVFHTAWVHESATEKTRLVRGAQ